MHHTNAILALSSILFSLSHFAHSSLVVRQWDQMPLCGQQCVQSAPLGTCSDTDWNCLCQTNSFMLSCVGCMSSHCARTGLVDPSLRALEGQCRVNGVTVALAPSPQAPPLSSRAGTSTNPPQPATSQTPPRSPSPIPIVTSNATASRSPSTQLTETPSSTPSLPTTTASSTLSSSNFIGPDLNGNSNGSEKDKSNSSVPVIAGAVSGVVVLLIAVVGFFLVYIRRLKKNNEKTTDYSEVQQAASLWGQQSFSPNRRLSVNSSHHTKSSRIGQASSFPSAIRSSRKGLTGSNTGLITPQDDITTSSTSEIYVRHQDSGLEITPSSYGVVELPPEYGSYRR